MSLSIDFTHEAPEAVLFIHSDSSWEGEVLTSWRREARDERQRAHLEGGALHIWEGVDLPSG